MKKILAAAALICLSFGAFAQAGSLRVINNTNCTVYYVIRAGNIPTCGVSIFSSFIALPAGASITYPSSAAVPGLGPGLYLNLADLYVRPLSCGAPDINRVGEPCTGAPVSWTYPIYNPACVICRPSITAKWSPAGTPGGTAVLTFF